MAKQLISIAAQQNIHTIQMIQHNALFTIQHAPYTQPGSFATLPDSHITSPHTFGAGFFARGIATPSTPPAGPIAKALVATQTDHRVVCPFAAIAQEVPVVIAFDRLRLPVAEATATFATQRLGTVRTGTLAPCPRLQGYTTAMDVNVQV